jgi:hypothetical protein
MNVSGSTSLVLTVLCVGLNACSASREGAPAVSDPAKDGANAAKPEHHGEAPPPKPSRLFRLGFETAMFVIAAAANPQNEELRSAFRRFRARAEDLHVRMPTLPMLEAQRYNANNIIRVLEFLTLNWAPGMSRSIEEYYDHRSAVLFNFGLSLGILTLWHPPGDAGTEDVLSALDECVETCGIRSQRPNRLRSLIREDAGQSIIVRELAAMADEIEPEFNRLSCTPPTISVRVMANAQ